MAENRDAFFLEQIYFSEPLIIECIKLCSVTTYSTTEGPLIEQITPIAQLNLQTV